MSRLIDADELLKAIANSGLIWETNECLDVIETLAVKKIVDDAPTLEERPKGKWYYNYQNGWHCSICNKSVKDMPTVMGKADFNFCPNCGANMKGEENG